MDSTLEARWNRLAVPEPPVDATIRPPSAELELAHTLAASASPSGTTPPRLGVSLREDRGPEESNELEVLGTLGTGGMSSVLLARQRSLQREVAVKAAIAHDASSASAILAEGVITGSLEHPAIVPVHLLGLDDEGRPAIVMKRIQGVTWRELIADPAHEGWEGWAGDPDDRIPGHIQILTSICNALHFAHSQGWVHRDIKPANVLIGRFGDVYVADWGIAARVGTRSDSICGTPGYLAPEMATGGPADERTDVYLLAACLHEVLVGKLRHLAPTALGAVGLSMVSMPFVYSDGVPFELAALANHGCHLDPDQRPPTAIAFREALGAHLRHRESVDLGREATALLDELAAGAGDASVEQRAHRDRLQAQAGFAIERALAVWPDNPVAVRARERLDDVLASRRAREAALENEMRERDPTVSGGTRVALLGVGVALAVGLSVAAVAISWGTAAQRVVLVASPAALWLAAAGLTVLMRGRVLRNDFNRKAVATVLTLLGFIPIERLVGMLAGVPLWAHYALDAVAMGAGMAVYGITQQRWMLWPAAVWGGAALGCVLVPERVQWIFGVLGGSALVLVVALAWREQRRRAASSAAPTAS